MNSFLISLAKIIAVPIVAVLSFAGYNVPKAGNAPVPAPAPAPIVLGDYNPSGGGTYRLQSSVGLSATTVNLSSFKEPISNLPYTMSYLNSAIAYGTLDPQTSNRSEFISFTGITQNSDGTAQLTGVTRGLSRTPGTGGCVASTTLAQSHSGQSIFILSNSPCFYSEYAVKRNDETISGYWNVPTPLSNFNPVTKGYVDGLVNGGTVSNAVIAVPGVAGETVASGTIVYLKQADGRWYKAASTIAEASSSPIGISQGNGSSGVNIANGVLLGGYDSNQSGLTAGVNYFLGATAGTPATATSTRIIGRARSSSSIYFDSSFNYPKLLGVSNTWNGGNAFSTSTGATTTIGAFPAYQIGMNQVVFTALGTSTFSVPSGITKVKVRMVGGGGGGGGSNASAATCGGAGGAYFEGFVDLSATSSVIVFVGSGGAGGTNAPTAGTQGQWTTFGSNGFFASVNGGAGGAVNTCSSGAIGAATTTPSSALVNPGYLSVPGGDSSISISGNPSGGGSFFGSPSAANPVAQIYGTGGSGRNNSGGGVSGASGVIIINW